MYLLLLRIDERSSDSYIDGDDFFSSEIKVLPIDLIFSTRISFIKRVSIITLALSFVLCYEPFFSNITCKEKW